MSTFENNLWTELTARHGHHLVTTAQLTERPDQEVDQLAARREELILRCRHSPVLRRGPLSIAAAAAAAAVIGTMALVHSGSPAYAVTSNGDGSTTVSLSELSAIAPANAALAKAGARVMVVPMTNDCAPLEESRLYRGGDWDVPMVSGDGSVTVGRVPDGYTMLLALGNYAGAQLGSSFTAPVQDPAPSCLLSPTHDSSRQG